MAFVVCLLLAFGATADTTNTVEDDAPLQFAYRTIFVFRAHVLGHSPQKRADGARQRLTLLVEQGAQGIVGTEVIPQGTVITVDGSSVFVITPGDIDEPAGETMHSVVERTTRALALTIAEVHERENPRRMLQAAGLALLATLLYGAVIYGVIAVQHRVVTRLSLLFRSKMRTWRVAGLIALHPGQLVSSVRHVVTIVCWIAALVATQVWLVYTLELFPYTRPWGEQLGGHLFDLLGALLSNIVQAIPGVITVVIIFAVTRFISHIVIAFFNRVQAQDVRVGWLDAETAKPTQRIAVFVLWLFALVMAYPYLPGAQSDAFKGLSVLLGIMVSIGASGVVGQIASGLILMYARALRAGDYVKIGESQGTVIELALLTTRLQTGTGEIVILPNALVVGNITHNFSRDAAADDFAIHVGVSIGYTTSWREVQALLLEAAQRTNGLRAEPPPYVVQLALADFYVVYRLVAYASPEDPTQRMLTISDLNANVLDVFNEHSVQIMSPHYLTDPAKPQLVATGKSDSLDKSAS